MSNNLLIGIVTSETVGDDAPTNFIRAFLAKAGYSVTVWEDVVQAQQALLNQSYDLVATIDEVFPVEKGDAFVAWLNTLPSCPVAFTVDIKPDRFPLESKEEYYERADPEYGPDMRFKGKPNPAEFLPFVKRVFGTKN